MIIVKEYRFSQLGPNILFRLYMDDRCRSFRKLEETVITDKMLFNAYDNATGELIFMRPDRIVYVPECN